MGASGASGSCSSGGASELEGAVERGEQLAARAAEGVGGAALDEGFEGGAGDEAAVAALAQVEERAEGAAGLAGRDQGVGRLVAQVLDGHEQRGPLRLEVVVQRGVPDREAREPAGLAAAGGGRGLRVGEIAELLADVHRLELGVEAAGRISDGRGQRALGRVRLPVARGAAGDDGVVDDLAERRALLRRRQIGEGTAQIDAARASEAPGKLRALEKRLALGERRAATGDRTHGDQALEVVAEHRRLDAGPGGRLGAQPDFPVGGQLRTHLGAGAGAGDHVLGARRSEAAVHAGEDGHGLRWVVGRTQARDPLRDRVGSRAAGEVLDAPVLDALVTHARCHGPALEIETVLGEERIGVGLAAAVLHLDSAASRRRRAVHLPALLRLVVRLDPGLKLAVDAERCVRQPQPRLDPPGVVVAKPSLD